MKCAKKDLLLYAITDRSWLGDDTLFNQVKASLNGGITFLQLREKELDAEAFLEQAIELKALCKEYGVPFVINDNVDIALKSDADGIHVGQRDMPAKQVRELIGQDKILGVSVQTVEQAILAQRQGADYLGVGAVFATRSKADADDVSHETLEGICVVVSIPVVAIGGIGRHNVEQLKGSGICGVAVIGAIYGQKDIRTATAELKTAVKKAVAE